MRSSSPRWSRRERERELSYERESSSFWSLSTPAYRLPTIWLEDERERERERERGDFLGKMRERRSDFF